MPEERGRGVRAVSFVQDEIIDPATHQLTAVHAQNAVLDEGGQGQVVEQRVEARPRPHAVRVAQPLHALQTEAEQGVDVGGL